MARRKPITAQEFREELAQDAEYTRATAERRARLEKRKADYARAQQPILEDLRSVEVSVDSVWDLVGMPNTYERALPILARHLRSRDYPDRIREGLARAMAMPASRPYMELFYEVASQGPGEGSKEGALVALAQCSTPSDIPDLEKLLEDKSLGGDRVHIVRALYRLDRAGFPDRIGRFVGDAEIAPEVQHCLRLNARRLNRKSK